MARRSRTVRVLKWVGPAACVSALVAPVASAYYIRWKISSYWGGSVLGSEQAAELFAMFTGGPIGSATMTGFGWQYYAATGLLAALVAYLWYRDRPYPHGHCQDCGYNLTGNVSGRCPECGTPVERETKKA